MRRALLAAALALAAPACARSAGSDNPGATGAAILQLPMSARAMGMGGAFTAVGTDASALYYNPAAMSRLNAHELGFSMVSGQSDSAFGQTVEDISYAGPTPFTGISGNGYTSAGANLLFAQNGTIEYNQLKPDGSLAGTQSISAGDDFVGTLGYSERVGSTPIDFREASYGVNHFMGVAGKYIHSSLAGGYSAQAVAADIGYLAHSPEAGLSAGAAILNLGSKMKFVDEGDPLPLTARWGLGYQFGVPSVHSFIAAADGEYRFYEKQALADLGLEYFWQKSYGLRLGYQFMRDSLGLTVGFGLRWRGRVVFDYAWGMAGALSDTQRFTVSYRFGGVTPIVRGRQRQPAQDTSPLQEQLRINEETSPTIELPASRPAPRERSQGVPGWIY
jgi:hypothetical protein